nr:hypothetical protein [Tanacetum cinerariifolium]
MTQATIQAGQITTESVQRRAPGNKGKQIATGSQRKSVTCYNFHGQGNIARECKEKKQEKDSQWFKDKALLMETKEKGVVLDAEVEAFLADVECTTHYDDSLAITTTTTFEVIHEDAYDSDVDEAPHAAAAFIANLTVKNVPTEVSPVLSDQISMITILDDIRLKLEGYMNTNKEQSLVNDSLKAKLESYKTQVQNLEQCKVKRDLEQLVTKCNKQNADLEEQIMSLKQQLSQQVKSNKSLKTKSKKLKTDNKAREDNYQEELVWLRYANKVVTELLQSYGQHVQIVPMLSKRPTFASKDLHKTALGCSNPKYLKTAQLSRPNLYIGDVVVNPLHTPYRVHDNEDTLVHTEVSRTKMLEKMKDPECPIISSPINYAKLNNLYDTFVPQKELTREHAYWLPANEVASIYSKPAQQFVRTRLAKSQVNSHLKTLKSCFLEFDEKRINRETNSSLPRKETVTIVNLYNVPVNLPTGIK